MLRVLCAAAVLMVGCGIGFEAGAGSAGDALTYADSGIPVETCAVTYRGTSFACGDGVIVITRPVTEEFQTDAAPTESGAVMRGEILDGGYEDFLQVSLPAGSPLCVCPSGTACKASGDTVSCQ